MNLIKSSFLPFMKDIDVPYQKDYLPLMILWVVEASFPNIGVTTTLSAFERGQLLLNHFIFQSGFQCPMRYGMPNVRMDMIWVITVLGRLRLKPLHSNSVSSPRLSIARSIFNLLFIFHSLQKLSFSTFKFEHAIKQQKWTRYRNFPSILYDDKIISLTKFKDKEKQISHFLIQITTLISMMRDMSM